MNINEIQNHISKPVYVLWRIYLGKYDEAWEVEKEPFEFCGARKFTHSLSGESCYCAVVYDENTDEYHDDYDLEDIFLSLEEAEIECERRNRNERR